ncbi:acyl-CoA dehydrogenase [Carbonactinospora thermoautotrophica]|uniref:phosphotransferase family protein n=1 Tax=Carbonactinospora thermoautotrophica TaxID=1469144 RepID=UPI00226D427D|nr:phosphotransferase family protein [Carbonactinospora thermoautotrophica]MCX9193230.1 acyl-CoA dehydrogenase [Carbonactinospora thermoautotrophica]
MDAEVHGTTAVPGVDLAKLAPWFAEHVPGAGDGPLQVRRLSGGRSNLTYEVSDGARTWVLRRPPLGHVLATAHDMAREYRVISALAGTCVPVPRPLALCADESVIGAPFYVMEKVDGVVYRSPDLLDQLGTAGAHQVGHALADVLAALHNVDPAAVGLADFGRPEGFLQRQLSRWDRQLAASRTRDVPGIDDLARRLASTLPASPRAALLHGDYRLDNVIVHTADPGRINAVLDWEMSTLGDPLADLGMFCMYWDGFAGLSGAVLSPGGHPGFPSRADLVERYAARSGVGVDRLDWYIAFAFYKIAVILEGIYCRYVQGLTVGDGFDRIGDVVPALVERGHAALTGGC